MRQADLYIVIFGANVRICRRQGRALLARRDSSRATSAVPSRELCRSRMDANEKLLAESSLSKRVPAHVAAHGAIVSSCVYG
jgi:hypothetical protein